MVDLISSYQAELIAVVLLMSGVLGILIFGGYIGKRPQKGPDTKNEPDAKNTSLQYYNRIKDL